MIAHGYDKRRFIIRIIGCSLFLLLAGCWYSEVPIVWQHPAKTAGEFQLDEEHCQSQVLAAADHLPEAHNPVSRIDRVNDCLRIKGYVEKR
jgi:hypothetical protein